MTVSFSITTFVLLIVGVVIVTAVVVGALVMGAVFKAVGGAIGSGLRW